MYFSNENLVTTTTTASLLLWCDSDDKQFASRKISFAESCKARIDSDDHERRWRATIKLQMYRR